MPEVDRRALIAGTAAALLPWPSLAAAPKATMQGPGIYRTKLGDYQLTPFDAGTWFLRIDGDFVRNADTAGVMLANLAVAGIEPKAIDTIVISHFHPDHIDGLKTKDGDKVFPNAEILVPEPEWNYRMDDAQMNKAPDSIKVYFRTTRR